MKLHVLIADCRLSTVMLLFDTVMRDGKKQTQENG